MTIRQIVFRIYVALFMALLAFAVVCVFSVKLRLEVFPFFEAVWAALPKMIDAVWNDPLYLIAGALVALLLWCLPWEKLKDGFDYIPSNSAAQSSHEEVDDETDLDDLQRGRPLMSSSAANRKAFKQLAREIAADQRSDRKQTRSFRGGGNDGLGREES